MVIGRVGGLLKPPPGVGRAVDTVLPAVLEAVGTGAFAAVVGRLGGIPFLRGDDTAGLRSSLDLLLSVGLSPPESNSSTLSSAGGVCKGASSTVEAISLRICAVSFKLATVSFTSNLGRCIWYNTESK